MELEVLLSDPVLSVLAVLSLLSYTMAFRLWFALTLHPLLKWGVANMTAVDLCRVVCPQTPRLQKLVFGPYFSKQQLLSRFEQIRNQSSLSAERRKRTLTILANVAPLLGLLGTVMGIHETFQALSEQGALNWGEMSHGISKALLTTQMGLMVAFPLYLILAAIGSKLKALEGAIVRCERVALQEHAKHSEALNQPLSLASHGWASS